MDVKMNPYPYIVVVVLIVVLATVVILALLKKGDVTAKFSFRSFEFSLSARDAARPAKPQGAVKTSARRLVGKAPAATEPFPVDNPGVSR